MPGTEIVLVITASRKTQMLGIQGTRNFTFHPMRIKVFIAGRSEFIAMLESLLKSIRTYELDVLGTSGNITDTDPGADVLFFEHWNEMRTVLAACSQLIQKRPNLKIIVVSSGKEDIAGVEHMIQSGVSGYLTANGGVEEYEHCLRKVLDQGLYLCTGFVLRMIKHGGPPKTDVQLNQQERELLELIAEGLSNKEIADKLFVSVRTIESRRQKLLEKTGCTNTATLVRFAVLNMLVK